MRMKASFQIINIDPPIGMNMAGFSERDHGAEGFHDPLTASVMVVDDGQKQAAIVSLDVIAVDSWLSQQVGQLAYKACGIDPANILISAIHTHSSTSASRNRSLQHQINGQTFSEAEDAYYIQLIHKLAGVICYGVRHLEPARIGYGVTQCEGLGTNRNDPAGYYDHDVVMLKAERENGELIGLLVSHACHPTVLNHYNYQYTADYVHYFRKTLSGAIGSSNVMFVQGCAGSASCRYTRHASSFEEAERLAQPLAGAVIAAWKNMEMTDTIKIDSRWIDLHLPVKAFASEAEVQAQIDGYKAEMERLKQQGAPESEIRRLYVTTQGAERNLNTLRRMTMTDITSRIGVLSLGLCRFIGLPGDVFGEIGRDLRARIPERTAVFGYTYDFIGYVVSKEGFERDCYERNLSYFDERAHDLILAQFDAAMKGETL